MSYHLPFLMELGQMTAFLRRLESTVHRGGFFSRCSSCSQHAPVHRFASWATSRGLPTFWIPVGLVLTSCVLPFVSVRLDSLCTSTSPFPPDRLDYSARAHSLSTQSARCQSLPEYLLQIHESLSLFSYLTNALFLPLILSTDCLSRVIKRDEPKGSILLAYFISDFLIVLSVCVPVFKEPCSTLLYISSPTHSSVFNHSLRSLIITVPSLF